jgi:hypothetical protein
MPLINFPGPKEVSGSVIHIVLAFLKEFWPVIIGIFILVFIFKQAIKK